MGKESAVTTVMVCGAVDAAKCRSQELVVKLLKNGAELADAAEGTRRGIDASGESCAVVRFGGSGPGVVADAVSVSRDFAGADCEASEKNILQVCEVQVVGRSADAVLTAA